MSLDDFGRDYLRLMLEVNKHTDGFVDSYIGPEAIKAEVEAGEKLPVEVLDEQLADLESRIPTDDSQRERYLKAMLRAAKTALHLNPERSENYLEEVRNLYDIEPKLVDESRFTEATHRLDELLPGSGDVQARRKAYREHYQIPFDKLAPVLELALAEVRKRTGAFVDLLEDESFRYELVSDKHWGAYNWYLGNAQSLIQFNTDIPINALSILGYCSHEGYPGHHTEGMLKEKHLYQEQGIAESAIQLLLSPSALISEGIATTAQEIIFPDDSSLEWEDDVLFPLAGIEPHPIELRKAINEAFDAFKYVTDNVAYLYHTGQINQAQALDYYRTVGNSDEQRAKQSFRFISHPLSRAYVYTYTVGYDLIETAAPDDKRPIFKRLLHENILPGQIASLA